MNGRNRVLAFLERGLTLTIAPMVAFIGRTCCGYAYCRASNGNTSYANAASIRQRLISANQLPTFTRSNDTLPAVVTTTQ